MLNQIVRVDAGGKEILLVGTAHVSRDSVDLVKETIEKENPDVVAVELCPQRHHALVNKKRWDETDISEVIKEGRGYLFLGQLLLSNFQRKVGDELGVKPGSEMLEAMKIAGSRNIQIALVDRDINVTLKRAFNRMSLSEKLKIGYSMISGMFEEGVEGGEVLEKLKDTDVLSEMMEELGREIPSIKEVVVDERNRYIADKIIGLEGRKIVAVVGAGHVSGVKEALEHASSMKDAEEELKSLEEVPEGMDLGRLSGYIIPLFFFTLLVLGFYVGGVNFVLDSLVKWTITTSVLSALGAALAFAHPLSILVAFLVAPLTTLHPLLAAGWFSGYVEAKVRKPKVKDFEGLMQINSLKDFWRNGVTRILLVIAFTNLGASAGALIGFFSIFAGVIPKIF